MNSKIVGCFHLAIGLLLTLGCSFGPQQPDYSSIGLVEVSGTITLDGQPLPDATIYFHDKPERLYSSGVTDANGRYTLMFDSRKSGIIPGDKTIEIVTSTNPDLEIGSSERDDGSASSTRLEKLPARYNKNSTLTYTVTKSDLAVNFELTSD